MDEIEKNNVLIDKDIELLEKHLEILKKSVFDFRKYERRSIFRQPYMRPQGTIRLPISKNIKDQYKISWEEKGQDPIVGAAMETLLASGGFVNGLTDAMGNIAEGNMMQAIGDLGNAVGTAAGVGTGLAAGAAFQYGNTASRMIGGVLGQITGNEISATGNELLQPLGLAQNPYLTVLFKQPNFKRHQFSWKLIARDPEESRTINTIISTFKYHMLPSVPGGLALGGTLLGYPSIVNIGFHSSDDYLYRFKSCVIEGLDVNYAPASTPAFFKGEQNVPVEVDLSINFLEIEYWTRQDFKPASPTDTGGYIPGT